MSDTCIDYKYGLCILRDFCPFRTAVCAVCLPDKGCYVYRWFEELIKSNKENKDEQVEN